MEPLYDEAIRDTIERFEATGSPVITDGEQRKYHNFWTYSVHGLANTAPDGFKIPFAAGHTRRMLRLTGGPFRYKRLCGQLPGLRLALRSCASKAGGHLALRPEPYVSARRRSLTIPASSSSTICSVSTRPRCAPACARARTKCRSTSPKDGWHLKIDPSGDLLHSFIDLNNLALARFSAAELQRIGVHTCPGGDLDSTHSADVDYAELLPQTVRA